MKFNGAKVKLSRALGIALTPKAQKYMEKRPYPPGQHGEAKARKRQQSVYGKQLLEKQRLRFQYNISERQMRNYFRKAAAKRGKTGEVLVQQLETGSMLSCCVQGSRGRSTRRGNLSGTDILK